jgi:hypothetical protein
MAHSIGENNPFLRTPGAGANEIAARAAFYGAKVRSGARAGKGGDPSERGLYWAYGKKVWARCGGLGLAGPKVNSDRNSQLALYSPRSHLPILPLLTGISASNEGRMGSIVKATISFTMYPDITTSGVAMKGLNGNFFRPGASISCSWGWSVAAAVACASTFSFGGKVLSFSWTVNADVSVNASSTIMSAGAIATGVTGNLSKTSVTAAAGPTTTPSGTTTTTPAAGGSSGGLNVLDAKQIPVPGVDLGSEIDRAMAELNPVGGTGGSAAANPQALVDGSLYGVTAWQVVPGSVGGPLQFCAVGIPWQPDPPTTDEVSKSDEELVAQLTGGGSGASGGSAGTPPLGGSAGSAGGFQVPIVKKFWYVSFSSMEPFLNPLISAATNNEISFVDIANVTNDAGAAGFPSAYPMEVIWQGTYGASGAPGVPAGPGPGRGIKKIWFNTDYTKETWRKFFNENNTEVSQKNLTSFLSELSKRANEASGDFWQLSATVIDKFSSCGGAGRKGVSALSVEDFSYCEDKGAFGFNASFGRPMLKNVSVSCQSSSTMGAAVMGGGNTDVPGKGGATLGADPTAAIDALFNSAKENGINTSWGDAMKACLKMKKKNMASHHSKKRILFPISFSVTVDGVSGLGFNEAVDTNLKPPGYSGTKFAINGIQHSVSPESWETTINAMMRAN